MTVHKKWGVRAVLATGLFSLSMLLVLPLTAHAALPAIVPDCARNQDPGSPPPDLNCALQAFGNIATIILGITGAFALLMFVYGGFTMLTSGGSQEKVSKGKTILTNAVIGIVIILTSGYVIDYGIRKLTEGELEVAGGKCADGKTSGIYVQLPGDTDLSCITACSNLPKDMSFKCVNVATSRGGNSAGCFVGICNETKEMRESTDWLCCEVAKK